MRVLVVDDDLAQAESWRDVLALAGLRADAVASAEGALSWLRVHRADVMVVDARLRGMGGADLVRAAAADPALARVRPVLLTGLDAHAVAALRAELPGVPVLRKPVDPRELLDLLATFAADPAAGEGVRK